MARHIWRERVGAVLRRLLVLTLSLVLLTYVEFGEAHRVYPHLVLRRLSLQGAIIQGSVEAMLRSGLPLKQFAAFSSLAASLFKGDEAVAEVRLTDMWGRTLFTQTRAGQPALRSAMFHSSAMALGDGHGSLEESDTAWRLLLPLNDRFEQVGQLELLVSREVIQGDIQGCFTWVLLVLGLLLGGCAVWLLWGRQGLERSFHLPYTLCFLLMAVACMAALGRLQSKGILEETRGLARSLGHRLESATRLGVDLTGLKGLEPLFQEYARRAPDIQVLALLSGDTILLSTRESERGVRWQPGPLLYAHSVALAVPEGGGPSPRLVVAVPKLLVLRHLWNSCKNSLVLFLAAGLLSMVLLGVVRSLEQEREGGEARGEGALQQVELPWFLGCFMEGLSLSFLPQQFQQLALDNGLQRTAGSLLFSAAFGANLLAILPAGRLTQAGHVRRSMAWGLLLSGLCWMALALELPWGALLVIRGVAGISQAFLFAGTQAYVLKHTSTADKLRGSTLVTTGYNGGLFSGMVIGALLVVYLQPRGVFLLSGLMGLLVTGYVLARLSEPAPGPGSGGAPRDASGLLRGLGLALRDRQLLRVLLLVGFPSRVAFAGVLMFALPLLLSRLHYAQEDIGQILMFYSLGVLVSNRYLAKGAGARVPASSLLSWGLLGCGAGLALAGLMGWGALWGEAGGALLAPLVPIAGLMLLGLGHGLILAPVVSHATRGRITAQVGEGIAASIYRLLERFGQVLGPPLVSLLLALGDQHPVTLSCFGAGLLLLAFLFSLGRTPD